MATATPVPTFDHIVVVMEENHSFNQIVGDTTDAPYINNTLIGGGALLSNYFAISHPSEPNYLAVYAGSDFGITDDNFHSLPDPTLDTVLASGGKSFTGFVENPDAKQAHNPWEFFPEGTDAESDFSNFPTTTAGFSSLPTVSFVIPNLQDDMHDGTIQQGDTWLQQNINAYAQWAVTHNSLLVVVWDEDDGTQHNQVPAIFYGAGVNPGVYGTLYNHYDTLSTLVAGYGLTGPRNAATAAPITDIFTTQIGTPQPLAPWDLALAPASDSGVTGDDVTNVTTPALIGFGEVGDTVTLFDGGVAVGSGTVASDGSWSITTTPLAAGSHSLTANESDAAGNVSAASAALTLTLDTTVPSAPSTPDLTAGSDSGISNTDNITNVTTPTFSGTAEAGSTVTIFSDGTAVGSGVATDGNYSITTSALAQGAHSITAKATDIAGNVSLASSALSVTIDTTAPAVTESLVSDTGASSSDKITSNPALTGSGDPNAVVTLMEGATTLGTTTADDGGVWSFTPTGLADGSHTIVASETDAAGNTGTASLTFTLFGGPDIGELLGAGPTGAVNQTNLLTPVFKGVSLPNATVQLFDGNNVVGTGTSDAQGIWTITAVSLIPGTNQMFAKETDSQSNVSFSAVSTITEFSGTTFNGATQTQNVSFQAGGANNTFTWGDGIGVVIAGNGANQVSAGNGSDTVVLGDGGNTITLGGGNDTVTVGDGNRNTIFLGNGNDTLVAGNGDNNIALGNGTDAVIVGNGNNTIVLGSGASTVMTGTLGPDELVFTSPSGLLTLSFTSNDELVFRNAGFDLSADNGQSKGAFGFDDLQPPQSIDAALLSPNTDGTFATTGNRFAYDQTTGNLYYDAQGSTPGSTVYQVADLTNKPHLTAADLFFTN